MSVEPLHLGDDGGGYRHFCEEKPVHCGDCIELAEYAWKRGRAGDDDEFLPTGKFVIVRYEVAWRRTNDGRTVRVPMMHKNVGGYDFSAEITDCHKFRWPRGDS